MCVNVEVSIKDLSSIVLHFNFFRQGLSLNLELVGLAEVDQ